MKRLLLGLLLALACLAPAHAQINCRQTVLYDASTNGSTKLITGVSTANVRICGFNIWAGGTATVKLVTGTGTNCATNEAAITPAYSLTTQTGVADSAGVWRGLLAASGLDVCIKTSAGVAVQAQLYYLQ
jgi:hypothetical protein